VIVWKTWFDIRRRFWIALAVACVAAGATVVAWANLDRIVPHLDLTPGDLRQLTSAVRDYRSWIAATWVDSSSGGLLGYLAIIVALGGILTEKRDGTLEMTLSLPVAPARWIVTHAGVVLALVAVIAGASGLILVIGGAAIGESYPIEAALTDALRITIGASAAIGITLLFAGWTRSVLYTVVLAVPALFLLHQLTGVQVLPVWGYMALGVAGVAFSIVLFSRADP
jgi:ABC-type transport system involved in multi-copper enzyme maturation permease subunit